MADTQETGYLSIGEVLGLLLEDFPDVTISKIRFLESQGLISPERTSSGYRKFYDADVELLRVILTEQRSNYLPLRVIKDRLETGEIDPTGEHLRPNGDALAASPMPSLPPSRSRCRTPASQPTRRRGRVRPPSVEAGDATPGHDGTDTLPADSTDDAESTDHDDSAGDSGGSPPRSGRADGGSNRLLPGVLLDRTELCSMVGMTASRAGAARGVRHRGATRRRLAGAVRRRRRRDRHTGVRVPASRCRCPSPPQLANVGRA